MAPAKCQCLNRTDPSWNSVDKRIRTKCCHKSICSYCWLKYYLNGRRGPTVCKLCNLKIGGINKVYNNIPPVKICAGHMKGYRGRLLHMKNFKCLVDVEAKNKKVWIDINNIILQE